jgi:hypothetical protein
LRFTINILIFGSAAALAYERAPAKGGKGDDHRRS